MFLFIRRKVFSFTNTITVHSNKSEQIHRNESRRRPNSYLLAETNKSEAATKLDADGPPSDPQQIRNGISLSTEGIEIVN